ncbi:MAG: arginine--tRNA ligase [Anaerolineae bacterium]|nr:arginine--tRNA ligase [Anaerolineae bacterium]
MSLSSTLLPEIVAGLVYKAIKKAQQKGDLPKYDIPEIVVQPPRYTELGDLATSVCMQMARLARMAPLKIAEIVVKRLPDSEILGAVEIAHPGFLNFRLSPAWLGRQVDAINEAAGSWGHLDIGQGKRVQVEYGSANPTGPLHAGFGRNVVLGDGIANVLEAAGYDVQREYYVNDAGTQVEKLGQSVYARYLQLLGQEIDMPEDGYQGEYVIDWAQGIADTEGDRYRDMPEQEAQLALGKLGMQKALDSIQEDCERLHIHYDRWFSEKSLYDDGIYEHILTQLRSSDALYSEDGAVWFAATQFGGDKDEVVIRSSGLPGYFASDMAYHYDKFVKRGFERVIDVWGADHQGHVPRMYAMMRALGLDPDGLTLLVYQMVTIIQGGENVILSKRKGTLVFLKELLDDVGADVTRFFLLQRSADSQMDFDIDLAKEQSDENPVYYVQYAHARIASVLRTAQDRGWDDWSDGDVHLLVHPAELSLIHKMIQLPEVVSRAAQDLAPHHLCYYAADLASVFHSFYQECRIVSSDPEDVAITKARLKLVCAAKHTLANALHIIGVDAPERM